MNDDILTKLKVLVERAVRPVRASVTRKRHMRKELLAHLMAVYEEEAAKHDDRQTPLARAKQRFGDPRELSEELQRSVPTWNRVQGFIQRQVRLQPGESLLRFAGKDVLMTSVVYSTTVLVMLLSELAIGRPPQFGMDLHSALVMAAVPAVFSFALVLLGGRISRALHGSDSQRSLRTAILYCLASLALFPTIGFLTFWGLGGLPLAHSQLLLTCYMAPAAPALLVLIARVMADEVRPEEEWARLEIEE
jgi:hypothetical protein